MRSVVLGEAMVLELAHRRSRELGSFCLPKIPSPETQCERICTHQLEQYLTFLTEIHAREIPFHTDTNGFGWSMYCHL